MMIIHGGGGGGIIKSTLLLSVTDRHATQPIDILLYVCHDMDDFCEGRLWHEPIKFN